MAGSMAVLLIEDYEDDVFLFERALNAVCQGVVLSSDVSPEEMGRIVQTGGSAVMVKPAQFGALKKGLENDLRAVAALLC